MIKLVFKPIVLAVVWVLIWLYVREYIPNMRDDEKEILAGINFFVPIWMAFATFSFAKAYSHRSEAHKARDAHRLERTNPTDDTHYDRFVVCIKKRLHPANYRIMQGVATFIILGFFLASFINLVSGIFIIGGITFFSSLVINIIRDIDDPFNGIWNVEDITDEWVERLLKDGIIKQKPA